MGSDAGDGRQNGGTKTWTGRLRLAGFKSSDGYPQYLRYVSFYDEKTARLLGFFTNNFERPALLIAKLYKCRWQVACREMK